MWVITVKKLGIIFLSAIILIFCLYPVVSAEVNADNINLSDDVLSSDNHHRKWPDFHIDEVDTFKVGDPMRFHVTFNSNLDGPVKVNIDNNYTTNVYSDNGQFYITFSSCELSPGRHFFQVEYMGDEKWFYEGCAINFIVVK